MVFSQFLISVDMLRSATLEDMFGSKHWSTGRDPARAEILTQTEIASDGEL